MIDKSRLHNWGRWLRVWTPKPDVSGNYPITLTSLESRYVTPLGPEEWYALTKKGKPPAPDQRDAWEIELAARVLAIRYHLVLKLRYVHRANDGAVAKVFRTRLKERVTSVSLDAAEAMALILLADALASPAVVRMQRAQRIAREILRTVPYAA